MSNFRPRIMSRYQVGMRMAESETDQKTNAYAVWRCHCDSGGEIDFGTMMLETR